MQLKHNSYALLALTTLAYGLAFASLTGLPFLDFPNHLARAGIIHSLTSNPSSQLHALYSFHFQPVPYVLGDLAMAASFYLLPTIAVGVLWMVIGVLAVPFSIWFYLRSTRPRYVEHEAVVLLGFYLSTNWFFLSGFFNYQLGVALVIFALGLFELIFRIRGSESEANWNTAAWIGFGLAAAAVYLMHLAAFMALCLILFSVVFYRVWKKCLSYRAAAASLLPVGFLSIVHLIRNQAIQNAHHDVIFRSVGNKIAAVGTMFVRFDLVADVALFLGFIAVLLIVAGYRKVSLPGLLQTPIGARSSVMENLIVIVALVIAYALLPVQAMNIYDIDNRMLPFLFIFLVLVVFDRNLGVEVVESPRPKMLCAILVLVNLLYLISALQAPNLKARELRALYLSIPAGQSVLPVTTVPDLGRIQPFLHTGALYSYERAGVTPYLFRGDRGDSMTYFNMRSRVYEPHIFWYTRENYGGVDWAKVIDSYNYVVVTKPFAASRFPLGQMRAVGENRAGIVFEVLR